MTKKVERLRSPIRWFGGKGRMTKKLLPYISIPHHIYVEPFGGGASMLMAKTPSAVEVYNDLNEGLVDLFRVLSDPELFPRFHHIVSLTPHSRNEYTHAKTTWDQETDPVKRAAKWFTVARQSFAGRFGHSWCHAINASFRGMSAEVSEYLSCIDQLPAISERLLRVQVECLDFRAIIPKYDTPETLFYIDPPYVSSTRRAGRYKHEMTDTDHEALVELMLNAKGMCVLSGYNNGLYDAINDAGYLRIDWQTVCHAAGRTRGTGIQGKGSALAKQARTESVWICPRVQERLSEAQILTQAHKEAQKNQRNANNTQTKHTTNCNQQTMFS
jgi:DNA adenine methylase